MFSPNSRRRSSFRWPRGSSKDDGNGKKLKKTPRTGPRAPASYFSRQTVGCTQSSCAKRPYRVELALRGLVVVAEHLERDLVEGLFHLVGAPSLKTRACLFSETIYGFITLGEGPARDDPRVALVALCSFVASEEQARDGSSSRSACSCNRCAFLYPHPWAPCPALLLPPTR